MGDPIDSHSLTHHPSLNPFGGRQETEFRTAVPQVKTFCLRQRHERSNQLKKMCFRCYATEVIFESPIEAPINVHNSRKMVM